MRAWHWTGWLGPGSGLKEVKEGWGGALFTTSHLHYPFSAEPLSRVCFFCCCCCFCCCLRCRCPWKRSLSLCINLPSFFCVPLLVRHPCQAKPRDFAIELPAKEKKKKETNNRRSSLGHQRTRHHHGRRPPPVQGHVPVHEEGHGRRPPRHDDSRSSRCRRLGLGDDGRGPLALRRHHLQAAGARPSLPRHGQGPGRPVGPPRPHRLPGRRRLGRRLLDPLGPAAQVRQGQAAHRPPPRGPGRRGLAVPRQG